MSAGVTSCQEAVDAVVVVMLRDVGATLRVRSLKALSSSSEVSLLLLLFPGRAKLLLPDPNILESNEDDRRSVLDLSLCLL